MSPTASLSALGLVVVFGLPGIGLYRHRSRDTLDWSAIRRSLLRNWVVVIGVVVAVGVVDGPGGLGLRLPSVDVVVDGVLFGFIAFAGTMILVGLVLKYRGGVVADPASLVVFDQPVSRRLAVAVTGAVAESVLFYGFAIETLLGFGSGPWIAGAAATLGVLFSRARWSRTNALQWIPGALVLTVIAVVTRTALVVVVIRLVYDVITLLSGDADDYNATAEVS